MTPRGRSRPPRPLGVTLLAVIQLLSGMNALSSGLFFLAVSAAAETDTVQEALERSPWMAENAASIFLWLGLLFLGLAVWSFWYARGYLLGHEWARRRGRRLAGLTVVLALVIIVFLPNLPHKVDIGSPWWMIISNTVVVLYLGRPKVRAFFRGR